MPPASNTEQDASRFLRIYIEDHLAGAAAGERRAKRLATAERDGADGQALGEVASEIALDREALQAIADSLGVSGRRYKELLARAAEVGGLVKLNGRLLRRSPLSTVVELEALQMAVRGKLAGWETLAVALDGHALGPVNLAELVARAERQLDVLSAVHARAASRVLGAERAGG